QGRACGALVSADGHCRVRPDRAALPDPDLDAHDRAGGARRPRGAGRPCGACAPFPARAGRSAERQPPAARRSGALDRLLRGAGRVRRRRVGPVGGAVRLAKSVARRGLGARPGRGARLRGDADPDPARLGRRREELDARPAAALHGHQPDLRRLRPAARPLGRACALGDLMKLSFLATGGYQGGAGAPGAWPVPPRECDPKVAAESLAASMALARRADELGFDWVSVSEHHYAPLMLTPNPLVWAGALTQVVKRAKIALLGPVLPINNPVRIAEETAMLDVMSGGRVVALFLRGVPFEWRTYGPEPADTKGATQEGIDLILKAWTAPEPFAWDGQHHRFEVVSV